MEKTTNRAHVLLQTRKESLNYQSTLMFYIDLHIAPYSAAASPQSVMNRETHCTVSYHCSSLGDKSIDLFH